MKLKVLVMFMIIALFLNGILPYIAVYAEDINNLSVITGKYQYTSNELSNKQLNDTFEYSDDCFMRSSYLGCEHLETLSAQVAISSASWYGEEEDKYEVDFTNNSHNVSDFLSKMKFENISTNKYYTLEKEEDSSAVIVGMKKVISKGKNYTLLAVIPRSALYKQEWVGDFNVGESGIHEGFKLARDEILRYLKIYIQENNITGNLKIWTAGHSRGAAVANMLGAFFAGGGIEYFGDSVSITPEDVYCYTYATPRTIIAGIDKNIELSVVGYRGGKYYSNDTIGDEYKYTKGGKLNPQDKIYGGIRNFISPYDFITKLPLESWNYTRYGTDISTNHDGKVSESAAVEELKEVSPFAYNKYVNKCGASLFEAKTIDLKKMEIVKDSKNNINLEDFVKARINGLSFKAGTLENFNNEFEEGLKAAAGIYGLALDHFNNMDMNAVVEDKENLSFSLIFTYLAYAKERLLEEGRAENEIDALKIAIEEIFSFILDKEVNDTTKVDELIEGLLLCACESENEIILDNMVSLLVKSIPENYQDMFINVIGRFHKDYDSESKIDMKDAWKEFFKACVYGCDKEAPAYEDYPTSVETRKQLYQMVSLALVILVPDDGYTIASELFLDDEGAVTGSNTISNALENLYPVLMKIKGKDGNVVKTCESFEDAADYRLKVLLDDIFEEILIDCKEKYGEKYHEDLVKHVENAKENITKIREAFSYFFLYEEGKFDTEKIIGNILTFVSNPEVITLPHYNEVYIAYAKASSKVDCGYEAHLSKDGETIHKLEKVEAVLPTCEENGIKEHYKCIECGKLFSDSLGKVEISYEETIDKSTGHDFEDWFEIKAATLDEEGIMTRTCKNDPSHTESKIIEKLKYTILEGNNQVFDVNSNKDIVIRANGVFDKFMGLKMDEKEIDPKNYTAKSGSTIVTLTKSYLDTLEVGEHTLTFVYTDGEVDAQLKISKESIKGPKTGDTIIIWTSLLFVSCLGIVVIKKFTKKDIMKE